MKNVERPKPWDHIKRNAAMHGLTNRQWQQKNARVCLSCFQEPRKPGQRWGKKCAAQKMREWRSRHVTISKRELAELKSRK